MSLWVIGTPIGTLSDLSPRALILLEAADVIAAEDTRVTRKLLSAYNVPVKSIVSLHAHNESRKAEELAGRAIEEEVALVSDAGMPGISDPGRFVVEAALKLGVELRSVPGPSALTTALSLAGFGAAPSYFAGFAPRKGRDGFAATLTGHGEVCVVFESPKRVVDLIGRLAKHEPGREACLCREISKKFEEVVRAPLQELYLQLHERSEIKGECVLVLGLGKGIGVQTVEKERDGLKGIAARLAKRWDVSKSEAYRILVKLESEREA
jgi:16S rRNA (cytidine1402-2'-O)-methyltransferase